MKKIKAKAFAAKTIESFFVVTYLLFEELIWNVFAQPIYRYFKNLNILDSLKVSFQKMNRYLILTVFITILLITEALGFLSGICIINGFFISGILIYVLKIPIAAFTFWLFELTKEKLMTFLWLNKTYHFILNLIDKFFNTSEYIYIKTQVSRIKTGIKQFKLKYFDVKGMIASIKKLYLVFRPFSAFFSGKQKDETKI